MQHKRRRSPGKKAALTTAVAVLTGALLLGLNTFAQAGPVMGTVVGGQGRYTTVNERETPFLSSRITGSAAVGDRLPMVCRTTGDTVEKNSRWIWTGAFYVADAFISENTSGLPACTTTRPASWTALDITMLKQVKDQWCWDASGLTIAHYWGYRQYDQYEFCRLAARNSRLDCNNRPATLGDMANALTHMGFRSSGRDLYRNASFGETTQEIANGRPFAVRIGYATGGGHMNVVHGYDSTTGMIAVGDPWPGTQTYTWWKYGAYSANSSFQWTHTRVGIHG
ncbi:papain-like cysteine protease family protein [Streptomyces sp. HMX112]|uniref:papain-like cysteine protease family protein n=1 Tax=Streptomyces sp. HMX112 TaxID=3390850 RepID=UPI003A7FCA4D